MIVSMIRSLFSLEAFYLTIHRAYRALFGEDQMLHYPLYAKEGQNLLEGQQYFTDYCFSFLPSLQDKIVLDVGCGNGVQSIYIGSKYSLRHLYGVDNNPLNIRLANEAKQKKLCGNLSFSLDDAQQLYTVKDRSIDAIICIESAFHYPDKEAFLQQVKRVLKPDGFFLIADLIRRPESRTSRWEKKVQFNNWRYQQYREAFEKNGLQLSEDLDFTDLIIKGYKGAGAWFSHATGKKGARYYLGLFYAKCLLRLYVHQLRSAHRYHLFVGKKGHE